MIDKIILFNLWILIVNSKLLHSQCLKIVHLQSVSVVSVKHVIWQIANLRQQWLEMRRSSLPMYIRHFFTQIMMCGNTILMHFCQPGLSAPVCLHVFCLFVFFCMVITIKIEQIMNFEFSIFFAGIRVTKKLWNCLYSLSLSANHLALAALSWKKIALGWFTTKDTHMGKVSNWLIVSPVLLRAQPRVMTSPLTVWDPLDFAENAVPDYERANVFYTASCTGYCFGS